MSYAIIGFGAVGQALARAFARKNINVTVASRRPPEALMQQARAIGPTVVAGTLQDAIEVRHDLPGGSVLGTSRGREAAAKLAGQDDHRHDKCFWCSR